MLPQGLLETDSYQYRLYSSIPLKQLNQGYPTSPRIPELNDAFSTDYERYNFSNSNVEISFNRAFQTTPTMLVGRFGFGIMTVSNLHAGTDGEKISGPVYLNYGFSLGNAMVVDYQFSDTLRLALIGTTYDYYKDGRSLERKENIGLYFGISF